VILDAYSVEILEERGFGSLIGVQGCQWQTLERSAYAYEEIHEKEASIYGLPNPRMTAQRCSAKLLAMSSGEKSECMSTIRRYDHLCLFPGCLVHRNELGGTVVSLAYPFDGQSQFFMGYFNVFRRKMMQKLISDIMPQASIAFVTNHPAHVYRVKTEKGVLVAVFNIVSDSIEELTLKLTGNPSTSNIRMLSESSKWIAPDISNVNLMDDYVELTVNARLTYLNGAFFLLRNNFGDEY
jgi:hypothetical protein